MLNGFVFDDAAYSFFLRAREHYIIYREWGILPSFWCDLGVLTRKILRMNVECGYREYLPVSMHIVKTNHQNRDSLELFSAEGLFLRNLGIKEFVLWRDLFFYGFGGL